MTFPDGRTFAFTILDDTDDATLENVRPIYDRMRELGFRTTKTAWPMDCPEGSRLFFAADTLQRKDYLRFVHDLVSDGFELGAHGATMESSERERTQRGVEFFKREFGFHPRVYANHGFNRENLYWGSKRFHSPIIRRLVRLRQDLATFSGEDPASPYFWGDISLEHVEYVRAFTYRQLDMLRIKPGMPYRLKQTPYVRHWFSSTSVPDAGSFLRILTPDAIDRLECTHGLVVLSTHLGKGFCVSGRLDPAVDAVLSDIASRPGWFVPVSMILDHLRQSFGSRQLSGWEVTRMEARFLFEQVVERGEAWLAGRH